MSASATAPLPGASSRTPPAPGAIVETFLIKSWLELMHSYERVTKADRMLEEHIRGFLTAAPQINHLVASERRRRSRKGRARETARAPAKAA